MRFIDEFLRWEGVWLKPYACPSMSTLGRRYKETHHSYRTDLQRDRDRIIHSSAFRRLKHKTQVYIGTEADFYRTRLTHTIEAAQIARTVARVMHLNEDLAETLALAHDLGHPPFGHAGEDELKKLMKNSGGFEHNLQSLRIVDHLERRYPGFNGLNLTFEVRESIRKHSVKKDYPVEKEFRPEWSPLLECVVTDYADQISYLSHDLDDSTKMGLITLKDALDMKLCKTAYRLVVAEYGKLNGEILARQVVRFQINYLASSLVEESAALVKKHRIETVDDVRCCKHRLVALPPQIEKQVEQLREFLFENVYRHHRVSVMNEKGKRFIRALFNAYLENTGQLPPQFKSTIKKEGVDRAICDYIAGMTDRYAQEEYKRLFSPFEPII